MTPAVDSGGATDFGYQPWLVTLWILACIGLLVLGFWGIGTRASSVEIALIPLAVLLLGGTLWFSGSASYTLDGLVITRRYVSTTKFITRTNRRDIRALTTWKHDFNTTKNYRRYEYLELEAPGGPSWRIDSLKDPEGFAMFKDAFFAALAELEQTGRTMPRRRPGFYETTLGRMTTLAFAVGALAVLVATFAGFMSIEEGFTTAAALTVFAVYGFWRYLIRPD